MLTTEIFLHKPPDQNVSTDAAHRVKYTSAITKYAYMLRSHRTSQNTEYGAIFPPTHLEGLAHGLQCHSIQYSASWDSIPTLITLWALSSSTLPLQSNTLALTAQQSIVICYAIKQSLQHGSRKCPARLVHGGLAWCPWLASEHWVTRALPQGLECA